MSPKRKPNTSGLDDHRNKKMQEVNKKLLSAIKDHQTGKTEKSTKHKKMSVYSITKRASLSSRNWQDTAYHQNILDAIERFNSNLELKKEGQEVLKQPRTAVFKEQNQQLRGDIKTLNKDLEEVRSKIAIYEKEADKYRGLYQGEVTKNKRLIRELEEKGKITPIRIK